MWVRIVSGGGGELAESEKVSTLLRSVALRLAAQPITQLIVAFADALHSRAGTGRGAFSRYVRPAT